MQLRAVIGKVARRNSTVNVDDPQCLIEFYGTKVIDSNDKLNRSAVFVEAKKKEIRALEERDT